MWPGDRWLDNKASRPRPLLRRGPSNRPSRQKQGAVFRCALFSPHSRIFKPTPKDLAQNPRNPRSLYGLATALTRQKRDYEASWVKQQFETAWRDADVDPTTGEP